MAKPEIHAESTAKKRGGIVDDYTDIHNMMDSSKGAVGSNLHRVVFHHAFGCFTMEKMFGINFTALAKLKEKFGWTDEEVNAILDWKRLCTHTGTSILNSDGKHVQVRDIAEQHILEDFRGQYIPSLSDYTSHIDPFPSWINGGLGEPPASIKYIKTQKVKDVLKD